jgi:hypothetical protein
VRRFWAVLPALLTLAACAGNPVGTSVPTGREFLLRTGESVAIEGTDFSVRFEVVASDSRCPADALCVTLGDAEAIFTVAQAGRPSVQLTLHTRPGEGQRAHVGDLTLVLTHLDPYPYSGRAVPPDEYRASVRVDRAAGN